MRTEVRVEGVAVLVVGKAQFTFVLHALKVVLVFGRRKERFD